MTSEHCISRSVRDSALFLALTEDTSRTDAVGFVREPLLARLRIGAWTRTMSGEEPEPAVLRAHTDAIALLGELGHSVESIPPPDYELPMLADAYYVVAGAAVANVVETIDRTRAEPVQRHELEPFTWSLVEALEARGPEALPRARALFARAVAVYRQATSGFDVLLTPTLGIAASPLGHLSPVLSRELLLSRTSRVLAYTPIHNIAGCPAMSVPLHWSEAGLPIGAHFAAAPGQDALLLGLAYELERARPWRDRWPPLSIPVLK
jgi:amidase